MTREERAKRDCGYDDNGSNYSRGYGDGIERGLIWADSHPAEDYRKKCCEVVRNTTMDEDLKSRLINAFMRL